MLVKSVNKVGTGYKVLGFNLEYIYITYSDVGQFALSIIRVEVLDEF
jgi:hypothetical protein